jgi:hypothetical protein
LLHRVPNVTGSIEQENRGLCHGIASTSFLCFV